MSEFIVEATDSSGEWVSQTVNARDCDEAIAIVLSEHSGWTVDAVLDVERLSAFPESPDDLIEAQIDRALSGAHAPDTGPCPF